AKMLANCNPEYRLMMLLSYLIQYKKNICFNRNRLLLTRKQLACMLGLRIETVIRTIKQLEQKEVLSIDKGKVHIKNMTQIIPC
ncbi:MAG: winged helix-turn-helix domain-containing protein, partial [Chitinophagaceae bacterium]|nr:winged helix-turn-helix domain-containing protein [Chitinophagaceae bacterium]